jgi:hypothetical protein
VFTWSDWLNKSWPQSMVAVAKPKPTERGHDGTRN